ncbi:MAG: Gfo/Idh/MocA family oxidoreductase [Planctomycetaceae bacterium]|nr:Gfo/Idh/MocA family oxidoreductase [Planctomycetaceae bacterium]
MSPAADRPSSSRRRFLQGSAGAVAAASLASLAPKVHGGVDETLKIALVGCGNRGTGAAVNALQTTGPVKLWAMADAFEDRLTQSHEILSKGGNLRRAAIPAEIGKRVEVAQERRFVGLDAYKRAIDACDVALLVGPPGFRPEHFEYAVAQGKHVFMEKPVATDAPGVRRVLASAKIAEQKGLKVGVGLQRHHEEKYLETLRRLKDGAIGDIRMLRCYWNGATIKQPVPHDGLTELEFQVRNWYFFCWLSGDHIVEQHVHNLDVCNWIMGGPPVSAVGMGGRQMRTGKDYGDIFDHHAVEYTYADGTKMFGVCRQMPGCEPLVGEFAVGTKGEADVGNGKIKSGADEWSFPRPRGGAKRDAAGPNPYQVEHEALFAAIRSGTPHMEAETGANATMTAILGRMATYTGRTVTWDEGFQRGRALGPEKIVDWQTMPLTLPDAAGLYKLPQPGLIKDV